MVAYAQTKREKQYAAERYILISQVITKESAADFTAEELFPIKEIIYTDKEKQGSYGAVRIILKSGEERIIDYRGIEGVMQI